MSMENILLYLIIYSFLGWCCECIYCSVRQGELTNRGFLYGPFCPIYGFGALGVIYCLDSLPHTISCIFIGGVIITSALEYVTSVIMEYLFQTKWWDYSEYRFHVHGRVCLFNSTLFGILCLVVMFDLHPFIKSFVDPVGVEFKIGFLFATFLYFACDFSATLYSLLHINIRLDKLANIRTELLGKYEQLDEKLDLVAFKEKVKELDIHDELAEKFAELTSKTNFLEHRLLLAFPSMKNKKHPEYLENIINNIKKRFQ